MKGTGIRGKRREDCDGKGMKGKRSKGKRK